MQESIPIPLDPTKCLGIDVGVNNFAACRDTSGASFLMEGRKIKSYNRWWNKQKAKLQSQYDRQGIKMGKGMAQLLHQRQWKMQNFLNQNVNYIVKYCISHQIGRVVIGVNIGWKQNINLGHVNNQNFVYLPYFAFRQKLMSKCDLYG